MLEEGIAIASNSVQSDPATKGWHIQLGSEGGYVFSASPNSRNGIRLSVYYTCNIFTMVFVGKEQCNHRDKTRFHCNIPNKS